MAPCSEKISSCSEKFGNKVDGFISGMFRRVGRFIGSKPKMTLLLCVPVVVLCCIGFIRFETENRPEELWVPQDTVAENEEEKYLEHFPSTARFNQMIVQASNSDSNVLTKANLEVAMQMHKEIESKHAEVEGKKYDLLDLCAGGGNTCASGSRNGVCQCFVTSILRQWNYDLETLKNDTDFLKTLNDYGSKDDLSAVLGGSVWSQDNTVISAQAFTLSYFLEDRSEVKNGREIDPINEGWEKDVFLDVAESVPSNYKSLSVDYLSARSFSDEFGGAISGDLTLVQVSYAVAFVFLGATLGKIKCGTGSRWTMALAALVMVILSTGAGFGLSSAFGLFFGPVHSLLPFVLLGIGLDDAFVIVNAFNRERKVPRASEDNATLGTRSANALARAGASITVTSLTDLVAFAISSASALPALASFCAYAAISIFFLWLFASTFFTACLVLDERRQRDNRRECLVCVVRGGEAKEEEAYEEGMVSKFFRRYHAPAILSKAGKILVLLAFSGLLGFGIYGAMNLSVEDSERNFIPQESYLVDYVETADEYFPSQGVDLLITFEGSQDIYSKRQSLAGLKTRVSGLSMAPPYISEPKSEEAYRNVMDGFAQYLVTSGTDDIGGAPLGDDNWPTTEADFAVTLKNYASVTGPGKMYSQDVSFSADGAAVDAFKVKLQYVKLMKMQRGEPIDDADKLIDAMDETRAMVEGWDDLPSAFPYSDKFLAIEGFKIIKNELYQNVGLAIGAVGIIVFFTVANFVTALLITLNVAFCIIEILGFMHAIGIVIDSVSVINIVLAVGLSVDYSAHIGHCFMVKGGTNKNRRVTESLADIGSSVLSGALSTFLAVVVLLFSSSYVFKTLSQQFALTVGLGVVHGLVLLPVLLSIFGPKPFSSAEDIDSKDETETKVVPHGSSNFGNTGHGSEDSSSDEGADTDQIDTAVVASSFKDELDDVELAS